MQNDRRSWVAADALARGVCAGVGSATGVGVELGVISQHGSGTSTGMRTARGRPGAGQRQRQRCFKSGRRTEQKKAI